MYAGAVMCPGRLIFAGTRRMTARFQNAVLCLFGALFGVAVPGWKRLLPSLPGSDRRTEERYQPSVLRASPRRLSRARSVSKGPGSNPDQE